MPRRHHPYPGWLGGLLVGLWREGDRVVENFPGKKDLEEMGKVAASPLRHFLPKKTGMKYPSQLFPSPKLVIRLPGGGGEGEDIFLSPKPLQFIYHGTVF